jgi:TRAP-type transport system periplasmic protein
MAGCSFTNPEAFLDFKNNEETTMFKLNLLRRALLIVGLLSASHFAYAQTKLSLGHGAAPDNPRHIASLKFAEVVKAKTNGRIEVTVSPSAQLGNDPALITAVRSGAVDITANSQGAMANTVPEYNAFGMPFLFADLPAAWKTMDGPVGKELAKITEDKGMVVLGYWDNGIRHMSNSKRPLNTPDDMKGLKMRTPPDAVTVDIMKAVGATAQQIAFSELYVALQQGVVDGQENPLMNIASAKLFEVNKFISLTGHKYEMTPFVMSKRTWDKLSDADKKAVMESADEATKLQRQLSQESDAKLVSELKAKGALINTANKAAFEKATSNVDDTWMAKADIGAFVKKVIAAARAK